jgi:asparagine synthase (glutamine-hydrolysing)
MCGIAGVLKWSGPPVDQVDLRLMATSLAHRGPDGEGIWLNDTGNCGLVHRRLAIIDKNENSNQPLTDVSGRYVIVFNGEIYNFLELRSELEQLGSRFRTDGDTEVILEAWRHWGTAMLLKFNGMWAFALHDRQSGETVLARDRFGVKPLYYAQSHYALAFASEINALRRLRWLNHRIDPVATQRTLFDPLSLEASDRTLYENIRRLPAGHLATVKDGCITVERWWKTLDHLVTPPRNADERAEKFREIFLDSVRLRMRSDVSIGTCLSGGFDSSAIVCAMSHIAAGSNSHAREATDWRKAFVATFPGKPNDELPQALEAAQFANVQTHQIVIQDDDATAGIDDVLTRFEDPYTSLPTAIWQTYRALRTDGTVVSLDGHGADELMAGYQRVDSIGYRLRQGAQMITSGSPYRRRMIETAKAIALHSNGLNYVRGHRFVAPPRFATPFDDDLLAANLDVGNERLYNMFHIDILPMILRNFERMSMAHGIEVRMPFMDWRLVTYVMSLPSSAKMADGRTKIVARDAMAGLMPDSIRTSKRKIGFNSPMPEWLNSQLGDWSMDLLARPCPEFDDLVDTIELRNRVSRLCSEQAWDWRNSGHIWPYIQMRWMYDQV